MLRPLIVRTLRRMTLPGRSTVIGSIVGLVALGTSALPGARNADPAVETQRKALHDRVDRVRAALQAEAMGPDGRAARSRLAQWYNWVNWSNGAWNNIWNDWPNQ